MAIGPYLDFISNYKFLHDYLSRSPFRWQASRSALCVESTVRVVIEENRHAITVNDAIAMFTDDAHQVSLQTWQFFSVTGTEEEICKTFTARSNW